MARTIPTPLGWSTHVVRSISSPRPEAFLKMGNYSRKRFTILELRVELAQKSIVLT